MKKHNSNTSLTTRSKARRYMAVWTALVLSLCLFTHSLLFSMVTSINDDSKQKPLSVLKKF